MLKPLEIVVGGSGQFDPATGTTDCIIPVLAGTDIWVEKVGYGLYDYAKYTVLSQGGFRLNDTTFTKDERFAVYAAGVSYQTATGSYTNGFNLSVVMANLFGRIGWNSSNEFPFNVTGSNLISKSGRKFNDGSFHAAVTLQSIKDSVFQDINPTEAQFNGFLETFQKAAIQKMLTSVFNRPEYSYQFMLFNRKSNSRSFLGNAEKFVGVEFFIPNKNDISFQIDSVALMFDTSFTLRLYLYNSDKKAAVWTSDVNVVGGEKTIVNLSDIVLNHLGFQGGLYYFGYYMSDLSGAQAINFDDVTEDHTGFMRWRFFESKKNAAEYDFDRLNISFGSKNYGLNLHISQFYDPTWMVARKAALLDNAIGLTVATMVLEQVIYSKRKNAGTRDLKETLPAQILLQDVTGISQISNVPAVQGMRQLLEIEYQRVRDAFYNKQGPQSVSLC